jgi:putative endonuclease
MPGEYQYFVYIMTNKSGTLYVGVTSNIKRRVQQHREGLIEGFTKKYKITRLLNVETFGHISSAIAREKEIKGWRRAKKVALIQSANPHWQDLGAEW